jgi:YD repeat-containing protein
MLSRTVTATDPDTGVLSFTYDDAGNIRSKVTSNLENLGEIMFDYNYNQLTAVSFPLNPQNNVNYTWGDNTTANANRVGRMYGSSIANGGYNEEMAYDSMGRIAYINRTVNTNFGIANLYQKSAVFNASFTYDTWGRLLTRTYPDGEVVHYLYNTGGQLQSVYGQIGTGTPTYYVNFIGYNSYRWQNLKNWANKVNETYQFDPVMIDRLVRKIITIPSQVIEDVHFTYDASGVVVSINSNISASTPQSRTQGGPFSFTITRDPLYRITGAEGVYYLSSLDLQEFEVNFTYNEISAITSKQQTVVLKSVSGNTVLSSSVQPLLTYNVSYVYDSGRPNLPSEVVQQNPGSYQKYCFLYDEDGNTVTIITQNMASTSPTYAQTLWQSLCQEYFLNTTNSTLLQKIIAYDEQDRLLSINDQTTGLVQQYQYSDKSYRVAKNSAGGLNLYLDRTYQIRSGRSSKYYFAGGVVVAGKDAPSGTEVCLTTLPVHSATCQYFYHSTNAGTNWVADMLGKPIAYFTYLTDGETWISNIIDDTQAPASDNNLPIRPSGDELDETGYAHTSENGYYNHALHLRL